MPTDAVFSFRIRDIDKVFKKYEMRALQEEKSAIKARYKEWDLSEDAEISIFASDLTTIIQSSDGVDQLVRQAERLGAIFKALRLTSAQIRLVFGTVRRIQMSWGEDADAQQAQRALRQLKLLKPKLAYQAQRNETAQDLAHVLSRAIDLVQDRDDFMRFVDFFEAILAYHVAAGGRTL